VLDVTEQLRRYGDAIVATVDAVTGADVMSATEPTRRRRPVWQPMMAAAVLIVLVAGGLWFATRASDPSARLAIKTGNRTGITLLDPGPLSARAEAALAWTGEELMVWGGNIEAFNQGLQGPDRSYGDGAVYDPASGRWRAMAEGPLPTSAEAPHAVATDRGVVIARGASVALWRPKTNSWRKLEDAPKAVTDLTFTGSEVLSVGANAALDLRTGRWQSLPEPPLKLSRHVAVWTGKELVVVGQRLGYAPGGLAFDPELRTWRELRVPSALNPVALSADRVGDRAIFVDYEMRVVTYRRDANSDDWQVLTSVPARFSEYSPTLSSVPPAIVVFTGAAVVVRTANGLWTPLPRDELDFWSSSAAVAPAGTWRDQASLVIFGITRTGENRFALVDPERLANAARTLQVGTLGVRLPAGARLVRSAYDTRGGHRVVAELIMPTGRCIVTSTNGAEKPVAPWAPTDAGRRVWSAQPTSSDRVQVRCDDPSAAKEVVEGAKLPTLP
jgi:hypothetical protein